MYSQIAVERNSVQLCVAKKVNQFRQILAVSQHSLR